MDTTLLTIIGLAQDITILACVVIFLMTPTQGRKEYLLLGLILLITFVADVGGFVGGYIFRVNMNIVFSIHSIITTSIWFLFYRGKIRSKSIGNSILVVATGYVLLALVNLFFFQGPAAINSYTFSASAVCKLLLALTFFYTLLRELPTESITKLPMFWINSAVLIHAAGTFVVNLTTEYLINELNDNYINAFTLHHFVGVLFYLLMAVGLWLNRSPSAGSLASQPHR